MMMEDFLRSKMSQVADRRTPQLAEFKNANTRFVNCLESFRVDCELSDYSSSTGGVFTELLLLVVELTSAITKKGIP